MALDQFETLANASQHAEAQHVDFQNMKRVQVVLVPFDNGAIFHCRVFDWCQFVEPPPRDNESADMLRQMAREPTKLCR